MRGRSVAMLCTIYTLAMVSTLYDTRLGTMPRLNQAPLNRPSWCTGRVAIGSADVHLGYLENGQLNIHSSKLRYNRIAQRMSDATSLFFLAMSNVGPMSRRGLTLAKRNQLDAFNLGVNTLLTRSWETVLILVA